MGKRAKVKQPKRILVVSCSHGQHINKEAAAEVLRVRHSAEFSSVVHLGDFIDAQAFMSKNVATGEGEALLDDMREGIQFVSDLGPTCIFLGNHEDRLWRLWQDSNRELVRFAAGQLIDRIEYMARQLKAELVPYAGLSNPDSWRLYGGTAFGHGYLHNVFSATAICITCQRRGIMPKRWAGRSCLVTFTSWSGSLGEPSTRLRA
jgi:hypothetical protein